MSLDIFINPAEIVSRTYFTLFLFNSSIFFQAYKGQITALLGHNGAGKSTTMNVLTGMLSPSDGSAQINGFNIGNEMNMVGFFYEFD